MRPRNSTPQPKNIQTASKSMQKPPKPCKNNEEHTQNHQSQALNPPKSLRQVSQSRFQSSAPAPRRPPSAAPLYRPQSCYKDVAPRAGAMSLVATEAKKQSMSSLERHSKCRFQRKSNGNPHGFLLGTPETPTRWAHNCVASPRSTARSSRSSTASSSSWPPPSACQRSKRSRQVPRKWRPQTQTHNYDMLYMTIMYVSQTETII